MPNDFNTSVIAEFRAHQGRVGGMFDGGRLILLTTTGARTGAPHTSPLGYLPDGGDRIIVIGSAGGGPRHPDWYYNLLADPRATVEDGVFTYPAEATVLTGAERERIWARAVEADPGWAAYQQRTTRILPVVALRSVAQGPPDTGTTSFGEALRRIHGGFRRELVTLRREVAASGPAIGAQLRVNCLTACHGLTVHHTGEDRGIFPYIRERFPDRAPVIDRLAAEHERVASLLAELRETLATAGPDTLGAQVDRLTRELEAHLAYEEKQLIPLLG